MAVVARFPGSDSLSEQMNGANLNSALRKKALLIWVKKDVKSHSYRVPVVWQGSLHEECCTFQGLGLQHLLGYGD